MGDNLKKILDNFKQYFKVNRRLFLFLSVIIVIGIIAGSIFSIILKEEDLKLVTDYLMNYVDSINKMNINLTDGFISNLLSQLLIILIIWILGFSIIGIPIIFFLFFYKCFIFGFTVGSIIINYKVKGILLSVIYMFPHHIINLLILMVLIIYSYQLSLKILQAVLKKREISFKNITSNYFIVLMINISIELILSLYGAYIVPKLVKMIVPMLLQI